MLNVILTRGLQGSGKTTWTKQFVKDNQAYKRISRDDFRHMTSAYLFTDKNEKLINQLIESSIKILLESRYNLVIDEMHLNRSNLKEQIDFISNYSKKMGIPVDIEIKDFPVTLEDAIERDKKRDFVIGEDVIRNTWSKYKDVLNEMLEKAKRPRNERIPGIPNCIVCDIDGTLALRNGRGPYDLSRVSEDLINTPVRNLVHIMTKNKNNMENIDGVIILSGREDLCRKDTIEWLLANDVPFDALYMRQTGDKRKDSIVKKELYETHIKNKYNCLYWIDDRKQVIDMVRMDLGITVLDVAGNNF